MSNWYQVILITCSLLNALSPFPFTHGSEAVARRCSVKKVFLKNSQNSQENMCQSLFFNKVAGLRLTTLLKKRLWHRCFPVNFAKLLRISFFVEHHWWPLLFPRHPWTDASGYCAQYYFLVAFFLVPIGPKHFVIILI